MRFLLFALALAACAPASPPQAELAGPPMLADMTYDCTLDGRITVTFTYSDGVSEQGFTGEACHYDAWQADVAANGPVQSLRRARGKPNYREWLARREREA